MSSLRLERVRHEIKKEISSIIHNDLKDPRIGFVTVTRVEITADLRETKIHFSILGTEKEIRDSLKGLNNASSFVRKLIGDRIKLRYTPKILFFLDRSTEYSVHIDKTIEKIKEKDENARSNCKDYKR